MKQFKSAEDYQKATPIQLIQHLISEIKTVKGSEKLLEYLDFSPFNRNADCGAYHCLAEYMASRSGIPMKDKHTGQLTKDFLAIFRRVDGYYSKALYPSADIHQRDLTWHSIFGEAYLGRRLEDRLVSAEKILENLKQKEK